MGIAIPCGSEVPRAYIVRRDEGITEEMIKDFMKGKLADYKQLRGGVDFVNELPKNHVGKILRRELEKRARLEKMSGKERANF